MSRRILLLLAILASETAATQLKPEVPTGSRLAVKKEPTLAAPKETRQIIAEFARCAIKKHRTDAVQLVLDPSTTYDNNVKRVADPDCLTGTAWRQSNGSVMSLPPDIMMYALADALVNDELPRFDPSLIEGAAPLPRGLLEAVFTPKPDKHYSAKELKDLETARATAASRESFRAFGECVVRSDPVRSHALLRTKATSAEEGSAIQSMMPSFGQCLEQGQEFQANRTMIRGAVALAYYRLAHAPRAAPAAGASK